jgi:large subunit ribosomal protein L3
MAKAILARKVGMMQMFTERGTIVPVTVLHTDSCRVVQRKTQAVEGYDAVQIGFDDVPAAKLNKPEQGHFKHAGVEPSKKLAEVRDPGEVEVGTKLGVDLFSVGDIVDVVGITQGKGFAGTIKRHNFSRGPKTHGSMNYRQPGSIGSVDAARTFKGMKMGGQMGNVRRTNRNLEVMRIDTERNLLLIKGPVPGAKNGVVLIRAIDKAAVYA